jgi:hypothetical protein
MFFQGYLLDTSPAVCYIRAVFRSFNGWTGGLRAISAASHAVTQRRVEFADLQSAGSIWPKEDSLQDEESGFAGESSA